MGMDNIGLLEWRWNVMALWRSGCWRNQRILPCKNDVRYGNGFYVILKTIWKCLNS